MTRRSKFEFCALNKASFCIDKTICQFIPLTTDSLLSKHYSEPDQNVFTMLQIQSVVYQLLVYLKTGKAKRRRPAVTELKSLRDNIAKRILRTH